MVPLPPGKSSSGVSKGFLYIQLSQCMCAWRSLASLLSAWEHRRVARKSCGNYAKVEQFMGRFVVEAKFYCRDNVRK